MNKANIVRDKKYAAMRFVIQRKGYLTLFRNFKINIIQEMLIEFRSFCYKNMPIFSGEYPKG